MSDEHKLRGRGKIFFTIAICVLVAFVGLAATVQFTLPGGINGLFDPRPQRWPYSHDHCDHFNVDKNGILIGAHEVDFATRKERILRLHPDCPLPKAKERFAKIKPTVFDWSWSDRSPKQALAALDAMMQLDEIKATKKLSFHPRFQDEIKAGDVAPMPHITHLHTFGGLSIEFIADLPRVFPNLEHLYLSQASYSQPGGESNLDAQTVVPVFVATCSECRGLKVVALDHMYHAKQIMEALNQKLPSIQVERYGRAGPEDGW